MNKDEILELIRAGYTKAEIDAMSQTEVDEKKEPVIEEEEKETEEKHEEPEKVEEKEDSRIDELMKAFKDLRDDLKKRSIVTDDYEVTDPQKKAEQILASIINPFETKK